MKKFVMIMLAIAPMLASANGHPPAGGPSANSASVSAAHSASRANSVSAASATGGTAMGGSADSSSSNGNQSLTTNDVAQAPAVFAPAVYASGSCAYGWSAGISVKLAGLSGGRVSPDANCDRREVARILTPVNPALALKVLCDDPYVKAVATPEDCAYTPPGKGKDEAPVNFTTTVVVPDAVSHEELQRAFTKATAK